MQFTDTPPEMAPSSIDHRNVFQPSQPLFLLSSQHSRQPARPRPPQWKRHCHPTTSALHSSLPQPSVLPAPDPACNPAIAPNPRQRGTLLSLPARHMRLSLQFYTKQVPHSIRGPPSPMQSDYSLRPQSTVISYSQQHAPAPTEQLDIPTRSSRSA